MVKIHIIPKKLQIKVFRYQILDNVYLPVGAEPGGSSLKFDAKELLFETYFGVLRIFGHVQSKTECIFLFLYNLIFQPYHLSSPLAPLRGGDRHCPKFDREKLLFKAFFGTLRIFCSVQPKSEYEDPEFKNR